MRFVGVLLFDIVVAGIEVCCGSARTKRSVFGVGRKRGSKSQHSVGSNIEFHPLRATGGW